MSSDVPAQDLNWLVSSASGSGISVKVARRGDSVLVGTTDPEGPVVTFTVEEWRHFIAGAKLGDFDNIMR